MGNYNISLIYQTLQKCLEKYNKIPSLTEVTNDIEKVPPFPLFYYLSLLNCILCNYLTIKHLNINYNILSLILYIVEKVTFLNKIQVLNEFKTYLNETELCIENTQSKNFAKSYLLCNSSLILTNNPLYYGYINKSSFAGISQRILEIKRVTKTTKGGRTRKFRVVIAIGTKKGWLGLGVGKELYLSDATAKARQAAFKNISYVKLTQSGTIPMVTEATFKKSKVYLKPLYNGQGIIAPELIRKICEVIGYRNIWSTLLGSSNKINVIKATLLALDKLAKNSEVNYTQFYNNTPYISFYNKLFAVLTTK